MDTNHIPSKVIRGSNIKEYIYQPIYLFEQLQVKYIFQGTKGTILKNSAINKFSFAFKTGK